MICHFAFLFVMPTIASLDIPLLHYETKGYTKIMRKFLLVFLFVGFVFLFSNMAVFAQPATPTVVPTSGPRFAACDLCGYCPPNNPAPSNWESCRQCLYPDVAGPATNNTTLLIDQTTGQPLPAKKGRMFTMLGCIATDLGSFQSEGAAASVVQTILNLIFSITGGAALLALIYGAFLILTSQAQPEKLNQGKRIISGAIIGVVFTLGSVFLVNLLASGILKIPGFGGTP